MKKILLSVLSLVPFFGFAADPRMLEERLSSQVHSCVIDEEVFKDVKSRLCFHIPKHFDLLRIESDLDSEDAERWFLFSNDQNDDIALIITQLEGPLTPAELLLQFFLKEFQGPVDLSLHTIFGSPSVKMLTGLSRPIVKVSYTAVQGRLEYLSTDYFFTDGKFGFNFWVSPSENDVKALAKLERQIEKILEEMQFHDCFTLEEEEECDEEHECADEKEGEAAEEL
jgi:hypothetical protein